ncbi:MAG: hypothetical protein H7248_07550 [Microbacteriaceae bacterium]|nr:hypothetical protein [Microbacteriaceae bacterium]
MEMVGGYRLVRRLGSGDRSEVWLGHAALSLDGAEASVAAVKIFRPTTEAESISREVEALSRTGSIDHVVRLDDLATGYDGRPVLILRRLGAITASALLAGRRNFSAGEAVTLIAPIAQTLGQLHRLGVAHGNISLGAIRFDDFGAPVLCGFGASTIVGPVPAPSRSSLAPVLLDACPEIRLDATALVALTRAVLETTPDSNACENILCWLDSFQPESPPDEFCHDLAERIFDLASAGPVLFPGIDGVVTDFSGSRLPRRGSFGTAALGSGSLGADFLGNDTAGDGTSGTGTSGTGTSGTGTSGTDSSDTDPRACRPRRPSNLASVGQRATAAIGSAVAGGLNALRGMLPDWIDDLSWRMPAVAARTAEPIVAAGRQRSPVTARITATTTTRTTPDTDIAATSQGRIGFWMRRFQRPILVATVASFVLLLTAMLIVPEAGGAATQDGATRSQSPGAPAGHPSTAIPETSPRKSPDTSTGNSPDTQAPRPSSVTTGDDPIAAATALLDKRRECLQQKSLPCLAHIDQPGSAAEDSDGRLIRQLREGRSDIYNGYFRGISVTLIQRLGNSALLSLTTAPGADAMPPASLHLVKGAAGWLIRDLVLGG